MANKVDMPKLVRRIRDRLGLSQEGLSRRLNSTKGAVQHWERGRNHPDLARLLALRQLCPPGPEKKQLDALIEDAQSRVLSIPVPDGAIRHGSGSAALRRENAQLRQQIARHEATLEKRIERLRTLEDLAKDLQRQMAELRAEKAAGKQLRD